MVPELCGFSPEEKFLALSKLAIFNVPHSLVYKHEVGC